MIDILDLILEDEEVEEIDFNTHKITIKRCVFCKKEFRARSKNRKLCSQECTRKSREARKKLSKS